MGFIRAFTGAFKTTLADEWKDFYLPKTDVKASAAIFGAKKQSTNNGVGENFKGNDNIISNGSKIVVPENCALITMQDGAITGCIAEAGGYIWKSDDPNSQSLFAGDGLFASTLKSTWEKVKFGGIPGSEQLIFYVNLKEIPGVRFGTSTKIQWFDTFFQTQVGAMARGEYSLKIVDPLLFIKEFVPVSYLVRGAEDFDLNDVNNDAAGKLLKEFNNCLSEGISKLTVEARKTGDEYTNTYDYLSSNRIEFGEAMTDVLESRYNWKSGKGLSIFNVTIELEYDEDTLELQKDIRQDDRQVRMAGKMGALYSNNMQGMVAAGTTEALKTAAGNENGAMMGFMGLNMAGANGAALMGNVPQGQNNAQTAAPAEDPYQKLTELKKLLDNGVITEEDFNKAKSQLLGI